MKRYVSGKKGKLSCCQCILDQIKANLVEIQPENQQNFQKMHFLRKAPGVNGLNIDSCKAYKLILENTLTKKKTTCLFWSLKCTKFSFLVPNSSYITYLHSNIIFWHLGRQGKADHRPDCGNSDSSVEPNRKRRPPVVRGKGEKHHFCLLLLE